MTVDVILTFASRLLIMAMGLGSSILTARFLGPQGRGEYFFIYTYAMTIVQFGNLGLHSSNTYLLAKDPGLLSGLLANSLYVSVLLGGAVAAAVTAIGQGAGLLHTPNPLHLWLGAMLVAPALFWMLGGNLLLGMRLFRAFNLFQVAGSLMVVVSLVLCWLLQLGVTGYLVGLLAAGVASALAVAVYLRRLAAGSLVFRWDLLVSGIRYATKAFVICLLGYLVLRANVFLLQRSVGEAELGQYSIAAQLGDALCAFPMSVATILFPELVRQGQSRWRTTRRNLLTVGAIMLVGCGATALLARPLISLVYGPVYLPAVPMLLWLLPSVFFYSLTAVVSQYLFAIGIPRILMVSWGAALLIVLGTGYVFIRGYAGIGASISLSITFAAVFFVELVMALRCEARLVAGQPCVGGAPQPGPQVSAEP